MACSKVHLHNRVKICLKLHLHFLKIFKSPKKYCIGVNYNNGSQLEVMSCFSFCLFNRRKGDHMACSKVHHHNRVKICLKLHLHLLKNEVRLQSLSQVIENESKLEAVADLVFGCALKI